MRKRTWLTVGLALVVVAGIAAVTHWMGRDEGTGHQQDRVATDLAVDQEHPSSRKSDGADAIRGTTAQASAGGEKSSQPASSASHPGGTPSKTTTSTPESVAVQELFGEGPIQPVPGNANPQVASVVEAARTGQHPERLSVWIIPKSFDEATYRQNPKAYLEVVEPGRVYATAEPAKEVPILKPSGGTFFRMDQKQTVPLAVKVLPGAPVTFTSFDLGAFDNGLTSMTVAADDKGVASVKFTAIAGTIANVNILAGSPLASGQVKFTVYVESPGAGAVVEAASNGG